VALEVAPPARAAATFRARSRQADPLEGGERIGYEPWQQSVQHRLFRENPMAIDTSGGHPAMDYTEHNRTYRGFLALTKAGIIFCVLLLIGMAIFLL
jgi:hypothetical protein